MKHPFDLDDFESFLSEEAEQLRMYPDDRVWRNIQGSLHEEERWPALTFGAILTGAIITVMLILVHPNKELLTLPNSFGVIEPATQKIAQNEVAAKPDVLVANKKTNRQDLIITQNFGEVDKLSPSYYAPLQVVVNNLNPTDEDAEQMLGAIPMDDHQNSMQEEAEIRDFVGGIGENQTHNTRSILAIKTKNNFNPVDAKVTVTLSEDLVKEKTIEKNASVEQLFQEDFIKNTLNHNASFVPPPKSPRLAKWSLQFYATPSISYRYLIDDKKTLHDPADGPFAPYLTQDANAFVTQRPKMGMEVGAAIIYKVADNFRLKTGLQLNYRQFGISAYSSSRQPATIELNRGGAAPESITEYTNISNQTGYRPLELTSQFVQLALPIGFDLKIAEINKVEFYMSAAGQLTYQLASRNYLLSSDFKNYIKQSDFERKVNANTAIEAFATFEAGGVTWQAGPQIRYQLLPGSKNDYPIREHLIDYGMKIGIIKSIK